MPRRTHEQFIQQQNTRMLQVVRPLVIFELANMVRDMNSQPLMDAERWVLLSGYILSQEPGYLKPQGVRS